MPRFQAYQELSGMGNIKSSKRVILVYGFTEGQEHRFWDRFDNSYVLGDHRNCERFWVNSWTMPNNYVLIFAFAGLTAFPLWLGYQIALWRNKHKLDTSSRVPQGQQQTTMETQTSTARTVALRHWFPTRSFVETVQVS